MTIMRDAFKSYYTKSDPIVKYMVQQLSLADGVSVLEPCAGDGVFVDALLNMTSDLAVDIYELNPDAVRMLKEKYERLSNIKIAETNVLLDPDLFLVSSLGGSYDRIIANPPYGGWVGYDERKALKKIYPLDYVKETYTLFLYLCLKLLKTDGVLVFIIPDTFLNLHMHSKLREAILKESLIREICLFPSSFFPGVNFGYANLCIISLQKAAEVAKCDDNYFEVIRGLRNPKDFLILSEGIREPFKRSIFRQGDVYKNVDHALFVAENTDVSTLINSNALTVTDIADCVTGFYSGNDKKYLRAASQGVRNGKKYQIIDRDLISREYGKTLNILEGITEPGHFVPIVKGGSIKYFKPDLWFMDWGIEAVSNYKSDKKARFQNASYYFRSGIGVPMVSSTMISAAMLDDRLFDQSIVGVFPRDERWLYYLLGFFNTPTCNRLIRTINPSANNPANYIKKVPIIEPSRSTFLNVCDLVREILAQCKQGFGIPSEREESLIQIFQEIYGF